MKRNSTRAVVIHTTAGNSGNSPEFVNNYFLRWLRWSKGGYHIIYPQAGIRKQFYDWKDEATNGILPFSGYSNANTIHLSYIGGINNRNANEAVCNISPSQERQILEDLRRILVFYPNVKILGHNQINAKYCPSFWVPDWLRANGIEEKNIDDQDPYRLKTQVKNLPHPLNFYRSKVDNKTYCHCCKQEIK